MDAETADVVDAEDLLVAEALPIVEEAMIAMKDTMYKTLNKIIQADTIRTTKLVLSTPSSSRELSSGAHSVARIFRTEIIN